MSEFTYLSEDQKAEVVAVTSACIKYGGYEGIDDAYAYPHDNGGIAWGLNAGPHSYLIARGVLTPEQISSIRRGSSTVEEELSK